MNQFLRNIEYDKGEGITYTHNREKINDSAELQVVREQLREFPSRVENLDTQRISRFLQENGILEKPYLVYGQEDVEKLNQILGQSETLKLKGLLTSSPDQRAQAYYDPELDMVLVRRDTVRESLNGPLNTEANIVHELAHASSGYREWVETEAEKTTTFKLPLIPRISVIHKTKFDAVARAGFKSRLASVGGIFEEGFAEMLAGKYINMHGEEHKTHILQALRLPPETDMARIMALGELKGDAFLLSLKYFTLEEGGEVGFRSPTSVAATVFELLCQKDPALYGVAKASRTDVTALREFAKRVDSLSPGLYAQLRRLPNTLEGASTAAQIVLHEVYEDKVSVDDHGLVNSPDNF